MPAFRRTVGSTDWERLVVWTVGLLLLAAGGIVGYYGTAYTAPPGDLADARQTPVTIQDLDGPGDGYAIHPTNTTPDRGFIFYPGGRVHPDAYLPLLAPIANTTNTAIFVPQPPLNLAVLDTQMASPIIDAHPGIDHWTIGGHSLGGAMACEYTATHPDHIDTLVLIAAYCPTDISDTTIHVTTIRGSADTVLNTNTYNRNLVNLPPGHHNIVIGGMNHSQAGSYRGQPEDEAGALTYEEAHEQLRNVISEAVRDK